MTLTPTTQLPWSRWWPGVAAWALWALTVLGMLVIAWLDQLSRQAGRNWRSSPSALPLVQSWRR
jgi:hypothetical protein